MKLLYQRTESAFPAFVMVRFPQPTGFLPSVRCWRVVAFAVGTILGSLTACADNPKPNIDSVRQQTLALLRQTFPYSPKPNVSAEFTSGDDTILKMAPFIVTDSRAVQFQRNLEHKLAEDSREAKAKIFTLTKGGKVLTLGRVDIGLMWENSGFAILKLPW